MALACPSSRSGNTLSRWSCCLRPMSTRSAATTSPAGRAVATAGFDLPELHYPDAAELRRPRCSTTSSREHGADRPCLRTPAPDLDLRRAAGARQPASRTCSSTTSASSPGNRVLLRGAEQPVAGRPAGSPCSRPAASPSPRCRCCAPASCRPARRDRPGRTLALCDAPVRSPTSRGRCGDRADRRLYGGGRSRRPRRPAPRQAGDVRRRRHRRRRRRAARLHVRHAPAAPR